MKRKQFLSGLSKLLHLLTPSDMTDFNDTFLSLFDAWETKTDTEIEEKLKLDAGASGAVRRLVKAIEDRNAESALRAYVDVFKLLHNDLDLEADFLLEALASLQTNLAMCPS